MSNFDVYFANRNDAADLLDFIDTHWQKGHIFTKHPELLAWQHGPRDGGSKLNFVVARNNADQTLQAILGFLPLRRFDPSLTGSDLFWAIWKVREDVKSPGLGLSMLSKLVKEASADFVCALGASKMVIPLYRALGYEIAAIRQHVLFNPTIKNFRIASGVASRFLPPITAPTITAAAKTISVAAGQLPRQCSQSDMDKICGENLPRKSWNYLCGRYCNHPAYDYHFTFLFEGAELKSLFVWRKAAANGSAALRVVDFLGDEQALANHTADLLALLNIHQAEYLDIQHHGLQAEALERAGFVDRHQSPGLITPGHFEPFESKNTELDLAYKIFDQNLGLNVRLLRGDSDQDRPNQMPPFKQLKASA